MTNNGDYLKQVLASQTFQNDDPEMKALDTKRMEIEGVLCKAFSDCKPTIKIAGSRAKHTMIKASYDLDIVTYFPYDRPEAGETLQAIYENVEAALRKNYIVHPKTSALRIEERIGRESEYTHIDVVPGRFFDETKTDVWLHQNNGTKERLKTNTKVHVRYIRDSGYTDAIRLVKLWRETSGNFDFKTFMLELLVVKILKQAGVTGLDEQLCVFWQAIRDNVDSLSAEDPANPQGNDLSQYIAQNKYKLLDASKWALRMLDTPSGWAGIFAAVPDRSASSKLINAIPTVKPSGTRPWGDS